MKKRLFLILSVTVMFVAGCGNKDNIMADMEMKVTETGTEEPDMAGKEEIPAVDRTENGAEKKEQIKEETAKEIGEAKRDKEEEKTPEPQSVSQSEQKERTESEQNSTDMPKPEESQTEEPEETKPEEPQTEKPEEPKPEETKTEEVPQGQAVAAYNPISVCSMAIAKCQVGGMITTTDNLANLLSEGKITQEEYDSYYPYDGLGYYSVFVEADLNRASTMSGRKLGSEGEIADYIAGMLLLETEPVFYIEYAGVYNLNGTDFYEFRCYR